MLITIFNSHLIVVDTDAPYDEETKELLFDKMKQDYPESGVYAVDMLEMAERLLEQSEQYPRQAETAAYCIRQAAVELFGGSKGDKKLMGDVAAKVIRVRDTLDVTSPLSEAGLQRLFSAIDELKYFEGKKKNEANFASAIKRRTGSEPISGDNSLSQTYQQLTEYLNEKLVHYVSAIPRSRSAVRDCYDRTIDVLVKALLPHVRLPEIVRLAELADPRESDVKSLTEISLNADGFAYFASKMRSPAWFELMDRDMLKSSSDGGTWPLGHLATHLKNEHTEAFNSMMEKHFDYWVEDADGLGELGFVGYMLRAGGHPWLIKALQASGTVRKRSKAPPTSSKTEQAKRERDNALRMQRSLHRLATYALWTYLNTEPSDPELVELADYLMNPDVELVDSLKTSTIPGQLVNGMDASSAMTRICILVYKIQARLARGDIRYIPADSSIADVGTDSSHGVSNMIGSLCNALKKAKELGMPTSKLVEALATLPDGERTRLTAWLYSRSDDIECSELVDFVIKDCASQRPTDDDALLLAKLERDGCLDDDTSARMKNMLGAAPKSSDVMAFLQKMDFGREDWWRVLRAHMMRHSIRLLDDWKPCLEIVDKYIGEKRRIADEHTAGAPSIPDVPNAPEVHGSEDPISTAARFAARKPETGGVPGAGVPTIVSELENVVKGNASRWAENPEQMVRTLRHPLYVGGYFRGLARTEDSLGRDADRLISAIQFARGHPWTVPALDPSPFGHESGWESADRAGIELIEAIAKKEITMDNRSLSRAWDIVCEAATIVPGESPAYGTDYLAAAENKPHTCALKSMMYLIRYTKNKGGDVPEQALVILTKSLRMTGQDGAEHRAILGLYAVFLHGFLPDWFEQNEPLLFGTKAPDGLGRVALDTHLMWSTPDTFMLEKYRSRILDTIKHLEDGMIGYLLAGMLGGVRGYDPESLAIDFSKMGSVSVSLAGKYIARGLRNATNTDYIQLGVDFWSHILMLSPKPDGLYGYGWWAEVEIAQDSWERLTLDTCKRANGKLEWAYGVAKRISSVQPVTDEGLQILAWLVGADLGNDMYPVLKYAKEVLIKNKNKRAIQKPWNRLYVVMLDRNPRLIDEIERV